jgi:hypothetical protein
LPIILTQSEYNELASGKSVILNGREIFLDEKRLYMIIQEEGLEEGANGEV